MGWLVEIEKFKSPSVRTKETDFYVIELYSPTPVALKHKSKFRYRAGRELFKILRQGTDIRFVELEVRALKKIVALLKVDSRGIYKRKAAIH